LCVLTVNGDADAALEATVRIGWNTFRHLVPLLTSTAGDTQLTILCKKLA